MKKIERRLLEEREKIQSIQAPSTFEQTVKQSLQENVRPKKRKYHIWIAVAAMMFFILIGYNYNALAYYGKKILGFDHRLFGTLKDLNESGFGQPIDQSVELHDGTILTINGMMTDKNQLILFYTLFNENGLDNSTGEEVRIGNITGFMTNSSSRGGSGTFNEDMTELKMIMSYDPVNPFAKNLTLTVWDTDDTNMEEGIDISFKHDPNKAMRATLELSLNETFQFDLGTITVKSITASPTMTLVEGKIEMDDIEKLDYFDHAPYEGLQLKANDHHFVSSTGSGRTTGITGTTFHVEYNALPADIESLQISLEHSVGYEEIQKEINLNTQLDTFIPIIDGRELFVKEVNESNLGVEVTIATDHYMMPDHISLKTDKGKISEPDSIERLGNTIQKNGRLMDEQTFIFNTNERAESLIMEGVYYKKRYNESVDIEMNK